VPTTSGPDRPARARFARRAEEYRRQRNLSFSELARTMSRGWRTFDRATVTAAVRGHQSGKAHLLPTQDTVEHLDRTLAADGELLRLWRAASLEEHAISIGADPSPLVAAAGHPPAPDATVKPRGGEVGATRRRDALRGGLLLGSAAAAAALTERIAAADPRSASLDDSEAAIYRIARDYRATPHADLADQLEPAWLATEGLLDTRVSPPVRTKLTWIAGWQAYYLGSLAFDTGHDQSAREFLALAHRHATDLGDQHLLGAVAVMRSAVAYYTGAYDTAATIAAKATAHAHPFCLPVLAGCHARAAALAHRPDEAHAALTLMRDTVWDGGILPGPNPGNAAFAHTFLAVTLAHLGQGEHAEPHAQTGLNLDLATGPNNYVQISGDWTALAMTYLRRPRPDPEQAATTLHQALQILSHHPTRSALQRAGTLRQQLTTRWPELPAVADLTDLANQARRELPPTV